jgi:hypothetical protein
VEPLGQGVGQSRWSRQLLVGGVRIGCFLNFDSNGVSGGFGLLLGVPVPAHMKEYCEASRCHCDGPVSHTLYTSRKQDIT